MNTLTVTKTIFRKGKRHNRTILSKETKEYELKTIDGNCRKADAIFNTIKPYEIFNDKDENISKYDFVKVNSISINFSTEMDLKFLIHILIQLLCLNVTHTITKSLD